MEEQYVVVTKTAAVGKTECTLQTMKVVICGEKIPLEVIVRLAERTGQNIEDCIYIISNALQSLECIIKPLREAWEILRETFEVIEDFLTDSDLKEVEHISADTAAVVKVISKEYIKEILRHNRPP